MWYVDERVTAEPFGARKIELTVVCTTNRTGLDWPGLVCVRARVCVCGERERAGNPEHSNGAAPPRNKAVCWSSVTHKRSSRDSTLDCDTHHCTA